MTDTGAGTPLTEGFAGHGSHRPGAVCLECERDAARPRPADTQEADAIGVWCREDGQPWPCETITKAHAANAAIAIHAPSRKTGRG